MTIRRRLLPVLASVLFLTCQSRSEIQFQQYFVQGEQLYLRHCSNCHQKNGKGLGLVYPPLERSDFMKENFEEVICLMKYGKTGEMIVNGKSYNQAMPGITSLTDLELAEIATYIYNSWGNQRGLVHVQEAEKVTAKCDMTPGLYSGR